MDNCGYGLLDRDRRTFRFDDILSASGYSPDEIEEFHRELPDRLAGKISPGPIMSRRPSRSKQEIQLELFEPRL
jgi:hypothetical protein